MRSKPMRGVAMTLSTEAMMVGAAVARRPSRSRVAPILINISGRAALPSRSIGRKIRGEGGVQFD